MRRPENRLAGVTKKVGISVLDFEIQAAEEGTKGTALDPGMKGPVGPKDVLA